MGACMTCGFKRGRNQGSTAAHPVLHPPRKEFNQASLTRFYSFEMDAEGNLIEKPDEIPPVVCGRTGEAYGPRDRIPSRVNIEIADPQVWWSGANLDKPSIVHDMGPSPTIVSRPIKVTVVPSVFFASHRDVEVFPEFMTAVSRLRIVPCTGSDASPATTLASPSNVSSRIRLVIFKLKMSEKVMVSLNEVIDDEAFDRIFNRANREELLKEKLKLILSPINSPLPIPAKKPKDAETVGSYFGMENVDFYIDDSLGGEIRVVSVLINIYSKWIIRKFLPLATSAPGRICDFILLSSDDSVIYAHFRLLATQVSQALIKTS